MNSAASRLAGPWVPWVGVLARLVVGGVWLVFGAVKLADPFEMVKSVRAYDVLPEAIVPLVGYTLPTLEVVVGLCLLAGLMTRPMAVLSAVLLVIFIVGISQAWARGIKIDCGCFGGGGYDENAFEKYPWEIARDVGLLLLSAWLIWRPRTPFSVDGWLFGGRTRPGTEQ